MRRIALGQPSFESGLILDAVEQGIILQDVIKNVTIDVRIVKSTVPVGEEPPPLTTRFVGLPHLAAVPRAAPAARQRAARRRRRLGQAVAHALRRLHVRDEVLSD